MSAAPGVRVGAFGQTATDPDLADLICSYNKAVRFRRKSGQSLRVAAAIVQVVAKRTGTRRQPVQVLLDGLDLTSVPGCELAAALIALQPSVAEARAWAADPPSVESAALLAALRT